MYSSVDPSPPTSTLRPPDVIHVIGVPRPSPFFALFRFCVLYTERKPKNKKRGRPGNETTAAPKCALLKSLVTISCIIGYTTLTLVHVASNNWYFGCWASLQVVVETVRQLRISFFHACIHHRFLSLTCFLYGFPRLLVTTLFSCVRRVSVAEDDPLVAALWQIIQ